MYSKRSIPAFLILLLFSFSCKKFVQTDFSDDSDTKKVSAEKNDAETEKASQDTEKPEEEESVEEEESFEEEEKEPEQSEAERINEALKAAKELWREYQESIDTARQLKDDPDAQHSEVESALETLSKLFDLPGKLIEIPQKSYAIRELMLIGREFPKIIEGMEEPDTDTETADVKTAEKAPIVSKKVLSFVYRAKDFDKRIKSLPLDSLKVSLSFAKAMGFDKILKDTVAKEGYPKSFSSYEEFEIFALALWFKESYISPHPKSWANAMGMTQFIPSTAKMELGRNYKDRNGEYAVFKPEMAILAFVRHIKRLDRLFDDLNINKFVRWHLILKSYNAGYGTVSSMIRRFGYAYPEKWERKTSKYHRSHRRCRGPERRRWLKRRRYCVAKVEPVETSYYSKNIIAWSFKIQEIWPDLKPSKLDLVKVKLPKSMFYRDIDSRGDLRKVFTKKISNKIVPKNCRSIRCFAPERAKTRYPAGYTIMVPQVVQKDVERAINSVLKQGPLSRYAYYKVKKGDNLTKIVIKLRKRSKKVSHSSLRRINKLGKFIYPGQKIKYPLSGSYIPPKRVSGSKNKKSAKASKSFAFITVKKGDSLSRISSKLSKKGLKGNSVATLKKLNPKWKKLMPGMKIKYISSAKAKSSQKSEYRKIKVTYGMNLWTLAKRWDVSWKELIAINGKKELRAGDTVTIPINYDKLVKKTYPKNTKPWVWASKFGLSSKNWRQILDLNNLSEKDLKPGRSLLIPVY